MPGGRIPEGAVLNAVQGALATRYGAGEWVVGKSGPAPYLNHKLIHEKKLDLEEVQNTAAQAFANFRISIVYTQPPTFVTVMRSKTWWIAVSEPDFITSEPPIFSSSPSLIGFSKPVERRTVRRTTMTLMSPSCFSALESRRAVTT